MAEIADRQALDTMFEALEDEPFLEGYKIEIVEGAVHFIGEAISRGTAADDFGPKLTAYATAKVPVYLIADPYEGLVHVYTRPDGAEYRIASKVDFGQKVDLTRTPLDLVVDTTKSPRDRK
ncbi:hypothetical protein DSC45_27785 [Streptomyces sp. YIM 130001]|nr:hypothetical protein DSC45_27785 [Streptomyces sp. YIM 130001]